MRYNTDKFTIDFDEFDQRVADLPESVNVDRAATLFDPTYSLYWATVHHGDELEDQLIGHELSENQIVELDNLDSKASHLHKLSRRLGTLAAPKFDDEFLQSIGVSVLTPETSGFLEAASAGQRYIHSESR